ncbi:MAG TPA: hypothetical protein VFA30_10380 [Gaiellaceae bacterium]|nr:hypothetical protein [Gaiellaceae bacterium]
MKRLALALTLAAALTSAIVAVPLAQASAHQGVATRATTNPFAAVPVSGTAADGSTMKGTFTVQKFVRQNGKIAVSGILNGTLTSAGGTAQQISNQAVTLPIDPSGTCSILHLQLGPLDLNLLGLNVHLNQVVLDITAQSGPGNLLGNLLCGVAHLLDGNGSLAGITNLLNSILSVADIAGGIPVTGTAPNGGTFAGTFTPQRVSATHKQLAMVGQLTGTLTNGSGQTQTVAQQATLPLAASGTCSILHLKLAPTTLNLLGLNVHLNRVVLNITAQSGPGNLLGNLLCGVAHLLDGNGVAGAAAQLNRLLGLR